jgi:hypothetical protein
MAEIRRKLVIVGDGACGKVNLPSLAVQDVQLTSFLDLSADCVFERDVP